MVTIKKRLQYYSFSILKTVSMLLLLEMSFHFYSNEGTVSLNFGRGSEKFTIYMLTFSAFHSEEDRFYNFVLCI